MTHYKLTLFGGFDLISSDSGPVSISAKKAKALLSYLALQPNKSHQRETLAALLWEECGAPQARQSLRQTLSALRKTFGNGESIIDSDQQSVFLNKDPLEIDALNFDELCKQDDDVFFQNALELYQGELLEGLYTRSQGFDDWLEIERSQRREKALQIMSVLLERAQSDNQLDQVIRLGIKITTFDPLRESAHRILMDTYHKQGRRNAALKQYRLCQQLLRNDLAIAPEKETQELYQAILRQQQPSPGQKAAESEADSQAIWKESEKNNPESDINQLRQVTLLSVHVNSADSVADPESLYKHHQEICDGIKTCIQDFKASVIEMHADSLMVVFGLPTAQSYDTEKAVCAAFALQNRTNTAKQQSLKCTIQIGINSGQIYIPCAHHPDQQPRSISGTTVNQAMSLAHLAQPEQILISNRAFSTISRLVKAEKLAIKYQETTWRLMEMADHKQHRPTQMVGRKFELQQFLTAAENCKETEYGQLILVRGEAGIGKTRLLKEWLMMACDLGFNCHSISIFDFGTSQGQTPAQTLTHSLLQLQPDSEKAQIKNCVSKLVAENILSNEQVNFLFDLLNIPKLLLNPGIYQAMDNDARQSGRQEVMTTLVQSLSERQPLFIIMEDIHWAESALLSLLGQLAADIKDYPVIFVFSTRFEGEPLDPLWRSQIQSTPLLSLDLSPLRQNEAEQMVKQTLHLVTDKTAELIQRSGCNPLFLEQLLFSIEQAVDTIPDSIQSIVAAKLDTLDTFNKRAAFAASVLGQKFSLDALNFILDTSDYYCSELVAKGLIKPSGQDFLFHHALILEGIYTIQLPSQRRSMHLLASNWYENKDPVLYAQHLDKAASDQAAEAYLSAAKHLTKLYLYDSAEKSARRGRKIAKDSNLLFDLSICHADILRQLGQTQASLGAFIAAEQQATSTKQCCQAIVGQGYSLRLLDCHEQVLSLMKKIEPLAEPLQDIETLTSLYYLRGNACFFLGLIDDCMMAHKNTEKLAAVNNLPLIQARALSGIADAYYAKGRLIKAEAKFRQSVDIFNQHEHFNEAVSNQVMVAAILGYLNRSGDSEKMLLEAQECSRKVRNRRAEAMTMVEIAFIYYQKNEKDSARYYSRKSLELAIEIGSARMQCDALLYLGLIDKDLAFLEQAYHLAIANPFGKFYISSWILAAIASVTDDPKKRTWSLEEGEKLLSDQAISHNHLMFYRYAIESCLTSEGYDQARYFMNALKQYTATEPLPWSNFFIQRANCLIRIAQGQSGKVLENEIESLIEQAGQAGFLESKNSLETGLKNIKAIRVDL